MNSHSVFSTRGKSRHWLHALVFLLRRLYKRVLENLMLLTPLIVVERN